MVAPAVDGIDLLKIAGRSISGWIPSFKTGTASPLRPPCCSQLEEQLLLWLEYHPQVVRYARGDIGPPLAATYRLPIPKHAPFAIGYTFEGKPHAYLPEVVGTLRHGKLFIAEAGIEDGKPGDSHLPHAQAAPAPMAGLAVVRHDSKLASSGWGRSPRSSASATTLWCSCRPGVSTFRPLPTWPGPCKRSGPGEKSPASQRSRAVSRTGGLPIW